MHVFAFGAGDQSQPMLAVDFGLGFVSSIGRCCHRRLAVCLEITRNIEADIPIHK